MTNYADMGINIDAGNRAVKLMGDAVRSTNLLVLFRTRRLRRPVLDGGPR